MLRPQPVASSITLYFSLKYFLFYFVFYQKRKGTILLINCSLTLSSHLFARSVSLHWTDLPLLHISSTLKMHFIIYL